MADAILLIATFSIAVLFILCLVFTALQDLPWAIYSLLGILPWGYIASEMYRIRHRG